MFRKIYKEYPTWHIGPLELNSWEYVYPQRNCCSQHKLLSVCILPATSDIQQLLVTLCAGSVHFNDKWFEEVTNLGKLNVCFRPRI